MDSVAADWLRRFDAHEANALAELVNFVLRCAGCQFEVNGDEIEDPDNAPGKLSDIQDQFQAQALSEYPLISKTKGTADFRKTMTAFINTYIHSIVAKGLLTTQPALIENMQTWIGSMSSAPSRPLRHTATVVSLEVISALAELCRSARDTRSKIGRQKEGEKKNRKVNQARIDSLAKSEHEAGKREQQLKLIITDWFESVFVHRYRDVDAHIRVDCVTYLSQWTWTYHEEFLNGQHLRYLGWVLSDSSPQTRLHVVRDIQRLYKDDNKIGALRQFTDKFRPRMVEMATRDGDINVRCSTIELLNILRDKGLLEPSDVDIVGQLIFDNEARIRLAVGPFLAAVVEDVYQAKREDFDGLEEEALEDFEQNEDEEDYEAYKLDWLRFKSVAELLRSYDVEDETARPIDMEAQMINDSADPIHSRVSLATEAFFDHVPALRKWDSLAGYLLKDITSHENIADPSDVQAYIDNASLLEPAEQAILLDVLNISVKHTLTTVTAEGGVSSKKAKKTKREQEALVAVQEAAAQRLASLIPRLLKRFGESPDSASAVLRLEVVLQLDVFSQLREDSTTFANLLEDIRRQFMSHDAATVISSAKRALLHARNTDELQEITDGKLGVLWDDTTLTFARLCKNQELSVRGSFHTTIVNALATTTLRIANLASISSCIEPLEKTHNISQKSRKSNDTPTTITPIKCILDMVQRGILSESPALSSTDVDDAAEDMLVTHSLRILTFYFTWHTLFLRDANATSSSSLEPLHDRQTSLQMTLRALINSRRGADPLRVQATCLLLETVTLLSTLRSRSPAAVIEALDLPSSARLPTQARKAALGVFVAVERDFARKASKHLIDPSEETAEDQVETQRQEEEALEAEPESSDEESEDDEADNVEAQARAQARRNKKDKAALLSEQALCNVTGKLVLGVIGGCIDDEGATKKRLLRNRARLGKNFAELVRALEEKSKPVNKSKPRPQQRAAVSEEPLEVEEDLIEEDGEEDLRRRGLVEPEVDDDGGGEGREDGVNDEPESVLGD